MIKSWDDEAWDDYLYWQVQDKKTLRRINDLIKSIDRNSFDSIGKPEALKHENSGYWSLRIDKANRLIYKIVNNTLFIIQCRSHYDD
jgi:toxin YoeB